MLPVHNHSEYSALDGYSHPVEIAERIESLGLPGAFLTDHGTVAGWTSFSEAMTWKNKKKGIKRDLFVGYGMEAYQARYGRLERQAPGSETKFKKGEDAFHLILLAASPEGYRNLLRLSDESYRTGMYYDPRVDTELLRKYHEGIVATSACFSGIVAKEIREGGSMDNFSELLDIFGDDFLLEIHTYESEDQEMINHALVSLAQERGVRMVYANDAHYATPDDWEYHEALLCAQYGEWLGGKKRYNNYTDEDGVPLHNPNCLYIMGEDDVRERLSYLPKKVVDEAIGTSDWLMERCSFEMEKSHLHLPKYKSVEHGVKDENDSILLLEELVANGVEAKYGSPQDRPDAWERAEFELEAIIGAGLQDYFLIVWDFVNWTVDHGHFVGPGRGSAGGSIIAYALGITTIDPLRFNLQFERFWNPGRADGLPDIDIDFERDNREQTIDYVRNKYGQDRVLRIGNHSYMRPRMAVNRAASVMCESPPYIWTARVKKIIESTIDAGQQPGWTEMMEMVGEELEEFREEEPAIFQVAEHLEGRIGGYATHASAIVISDIDLQDQLPARVTSDDEKNRVLCTQVEMREVEKLGFPKFDLLGIRNLDTIMKAAMLSGEFGEDTPENRRKVVKFFHDLDVDSLPDPYWEQIDNGHTLGFFQIEESPSPRRIGKTMKPRNIEDLALIVALNRPGPLRGGVVDRYLARRVGDEDPSFADPILRDILEVSYGDFIFQEQVIAYFREIGYSLSDADHIRKILGKKLTEEMQAEFPTYMKFATEFMTAGKAEQIWEAIEDFSKYSFNKAHAVGYAIILAWCMYAKWKWPLEFIMANIETDPKRVSQWLNEARRIDVNVLPPDINLSEEVISRYGDNIIYGLRDIKGLGPKHAEWVVENRPFDSVEAFYDRATEQPIVVNAGHRQKLMDAGAFDSFGFRLAKCSICEGKGRVPVEGFKRKYQDCDHCVGGLTPVDIPPPKELGRLEEELLGITLTDVYAEALARESNQKHLEDASLISDVDWDTDGDKVTVVGVLEDVVARKDKNKNTYLRCKLRWQGEEVGFSVFDSHYGNDAKSKIEAYDFLLKPGTLGTFNLETSPRGARFVKGWLLQ